MGESLASASKALAVPSSYADHERYYISSGKQFRFYPIPTSNYRLAQTTESVKTKGTLWQLNPSASDDATTTNTTWDVFTNHPVFAARYDSPLVTGNDSKTIYWEFEITSLGYEGKNASVAFGFLVKDEGSDAVSKDEKGSLRQYDLVTGGAPTSLSGPSLMWSSADGGIYESGKKISAETFSAKAGDTIGLGVTFLFDEKISMVPTRDVHDSKSVKPSKVSRAMDRKGNQTARVADAKDLVACPSQVFVTVNGVATPLEGEIARGFLNGTLDVFPVLSASGPGVSGKVRIGEAVKFEGEGGTQDAAEAAKGNAGRPGYKQSKLSKIFKAPGGIWMFGGGPAVVG